MFFIILYIVAFFCFFLSLVNSSKIYKLLFILLLIDLTSLSIIGSLPNSFKVCVLLLPLIILVILFLFASLTIGGIMPLLNYMFDVYKSHHYCYIRLQSLFLLWGPLRTYLNNNKNFHSLSMCFQLFLATQIVLICLLKEVLKKYYVILFLYFFTTNTTLIFFIWVNHILLFIILVSLLGIDPKLVDFLSPFFGYCCLAWLGSYQTLRLDTKKIEFLPPDNDPINKNKDHYRKFNQNIDKLHKKNKSVNAFLAKVLIRTNNDKKS